MARNEGDQQEIVLGNKQLLSIFFIVVVLMGVSFTIGYIIGRNASSVSAAGAGPAATVSPRSSNAIPPASSDAQTEEKRVEPEPATKSPDPTDSSSSRTTGTQPAKPYEERAQAPRREEAEAKPDTKAPAAAAPTGTGTYLQVASLKREDADHLVNMLRGRGYPALIGESPKEGLFRVLIGPYKDIPALADAKQKLRGAGFDPIVAR
jgi:cell division septation protein DedD